MPLLEWSCQDLLYNIQVRLHEVINNLPNRFVAGVVRVLTFPLGKPYKRPSDKLGQQLAELLLSTSALRDRLTEGMYIPEDTAEPVAQLEDALEKTEAAAPALRKLRTAIKTGSLPAGDPETHVDAGAKAGIITDQEAAGIHAAIAARKLVIQVDEFLPEYLTRERREWGSNNLDGVAGQSM